MGFLQDRIEWQPWGPTLDSPLDIPTHGITGEALGEFPMFRYVNGEAQFRNAKGDEIALFHMWP